MNTYTVSGPFPFRRHASGSTFRAETDPEIEGALRRGSITKDKTKNPASPPKVSAVGADTKSTKEDK